MILTKEELVAIHQNEIRVLLHLASKVEPAMLHYRPSPKQRSMLELLHYLVVMGPIRYRSIKAGEFDPDSWRTAWKAEEAAAKAMGLEEVKDALGKQPALLAELLDSCSDADLRAEIEMFGRKASRGAMLANLVLSHHAAYRMQLFLYLKACGLEDLTSANLWGGRDAAAQASS